MLRYEIEGGSLPVLICYPEVGQTLCTERGSMSWMSPNMRMDAMLMKIQLPQATNIRRKLLILPKKKGLSLLLFQQR